MRQAYDYWQNQPGNYRSPGLATGAFYGAGEILVTGVAPVTGRAAPLWPLAVRLRPPRGGIPLSPSSFPRAPVDRAKARPRGPRRRTTPRSFSHSASTAWGLSPDALVVVLASGQTPTEPILRRREDEPPAACGHPQLAVRAQRLPTVVGGEIVIGMLPWASGLGCLQATQVTPALTSLEDKVRFLGEICAPARLPEESPGGRRPLQPFYLLSRLPPLTYSPTHF